MKLTSARVRMFRNVIDSGVIRFQGDVTCLVGKNESGKTALLVALHRLNPANDTAGFSTQNDYPRWRLTRDRKSGDLDEARPIEATFTLSPEDRAAVETTLWPGVLPSDEFTVYRTYDGTTMLVLAVDEAAAMQRIFDDLEVHEGLQGQLLPLEGLQAVRDRCVELVAAAAAAAAAEERTLEKEIGQHADWIITEIDGRLPKSRSLLSVAADTLTGRLPKFFYSATTKHCPHVSISMKSLLPRRRPARLQSRQPGR